MKKFVVLVSLIWLSFSAAAFAGPKERLVAATLQLEEAILKAKVAQVHILRSDAEKGIYGHPSRLTEIQKDKFGLIDAYLEFRGARMDYASAGVEALLINLDSQIGSLAAVKGDLCQQIEPRDTTNKEMGLVLGVCDTDRVIAELQQLYAVLRSF